MNVVLLVPPTAREARRRTLVAAGLAVIVGWTVGRATDGLVALTLTFWVVFVLAAALVDMRSGRLPDVIVVPGIAVVFVWAYLSGQFAGLAGGALLFGVPVLVAHLARPDGLGFGDVKYTVLLGAGIGLVAVPLVLPAYLLAALAHSIACIAVRARGRLVPFGPALAVSSIMVVIAGLIGRL